MMDWPGSSPAMASAASPKASNAHNEGSDGEKQKSVFFISWSFFFVRNWSNEYRKSEHYHNTGQLFKLRDNVKINRIIIKIIAFEYERKQFRN